MQTTHNWLSTAVNYQFAQAGKADLIQQHLANMIANPNDEQVMAVSKRRSHCSFHHFSN